MQNEALSEEEYIRIREKAECFYKGMTEVYCPYFNEKVNINAKGWEHLLYKSRDNRRSKEDQIMRLKLLKFVPQILASSHTVQGIGERIEWIKQWKHQREEGVPVTRKYYEFVSVIGNVRVKIIVKEQEDGVKHFWSIIPFWKINKVTKKRKLHDGNLKED